jgi:hypothetical protein
LAYKGASSNQVRTGIGRRVWIKIDQFIVLFDCGATVPQRDRLWRVEWPLESYHFQ